MTGTTDADINHLRRELLYRLDRQPFDSCSPELLRALIAAFDLANPLDARAAAPPHTGGPRLHLVRQAAVNQAMNVDITHLQRELTWRFQAHPVWTWPPEMLLAMLGLFDVYLTTPTSPPPTYAGKPDLQVVR
ncbi:hypothetical protein [Mycobacterium attenuatum]|uniref:hypothetical protein n=1 Tax=Mycobacterium attenuatum TaxID=2341086 RepID=UPI000F016738|nr:hypothetical protein [Mycobacterium attenuatum]VBA61219.1 hypothetical protein LAUMK41_04595 [Mycobacterium attenuatum]